MIDRKDILSLNFYKKTKFTGSCQGMCYLIRKESKEDGSQMLKAYLWPGPYAFAATDDSLKQSEEFEFSDEGLSQVTAWLNLKIEEFKNV